jgi:K+ transporter
MVDLYICNLTDRMKKRQLDSARLRFYYIWNPIGVVLWFWVVQVLDIDSWLEYRATVSAISPYHAVNTLLLSYKNQAVNAV